MDYFRKQNCECVCEYWELRRAQNYWRANKCTTVYCCKLVRVDHAIMRIYTQKTKQWTASIFIILTADWHFSNIMAHCKSLYRDIILLKATIYHPYIVEIKSLLIIFPHCLIFFMVKTNAFWVNSIKKSQAYRDSTQPIILGWFNTSNPFSLTLWCVLPTNTEMSIYREKMFFRKCWIVKWGTAKVLAVH